ncbi:MAG: DUF934 domain-containing protein [Rhodobacteraceae bacterium]|nr:DUF934 domain-containing protein [Paracoccaceae bacterium]
MSVIVTDTGFAPAPDRLLPGPADLDGAAEVDLANTDDPEALRPHLARLTLVRVAFPAFADGRGFTLGRRLRAMGYRGRLLALGPVIADQYPMLRRLGFDGAEIPEDLAARQPPAQWATGPAPRDYQSRLRA